MNPSQLRNDCRQLAHRLEGTPEWPELRAIYLELTTVVGQIQAAVAESTRHASATSSSTEIEDGLARLKSGVRQVGIDIRLASPAALTIGLRIGLDRAEAVLDELARS